MENIFIKKIIQKKIRCYFVSPHFDDAALSAGDLMAYLSQKTQVTVINVFTKAGSPDTLSAKKFIKDSGFHDAKLLFEERDREDGKALSNIKVNRINLGFTDALWRTRKVSAVRRLLAFFLPELMAIYPTYRFHIQNGKIAKADINLVNRIIAQLKKNIRNKKAVVFCPAGIGNHVDHLITKAACEKLGIPVVAWTDFPYIRRTGNVILPSFKGSFTARQNVTLKTRIINLYKTQLNGLFPGGKFIPVTEKYYILTKNI